MSNYFDSFEHVFNNFYEILELNEDASVDQIRKGYLRLAKKYHPDQGGNSEMFELISKAYECLSKPEFKKNYDLEFNNMKDDEYKNKLNIDYLKYEFDDFKKKNDKMLSNSEIDNIYNNFFKNNNIQKDNSFKTNDFINKITDIKTEREMNEIEFTDDYYKNIIEKNDINVNDLFEFIKQNNNQQLISVPIESHNSISTNMSYSSFIENENTVPMKPYGLENNFDTNNTKKDFNIVKFSEWKQEKKTDKKITSNDIDNYIEQRNNIEREITNEIENNFKDYKKKTDIEKFMKLENKINNDDLFLTK